MKKKENKKNPNSVFNKITPVLLSVILLLAFFVRVYRISATLGFYFDQGRDALAIWDLIHNHKFFLIGPTTGIAGIFRGPFYYYLIAPAYWLGAGNPVFPSVFLSLLTVIAIFMLYYLAVKIQDKPTGIFAVIIASFSFYLVIASRWLSNPTPMLLLSMLLIFFMFLVADGKKWGWAGIAFISGMSLFHFGSSGELFYFPAIAIFAIWQHKNLPTKKIFAVSILLFILTILPQAIFDIRHDGILRNNIKKFLVDEQSFKTSFWEVAKLRINFYYDVFTNKIFELRNSREIMLLSVVAIAFIFSLPKLLKNKKAKIALLVFAMPLAGLLFFQGNSGNIYDYYLTGYYLIFILLFALGLGNIWKYKLGKIFIIYFFYIFLTSNLNVLFSRLNDNGDGTNTIIFATQKNALDWIYQDASGKEFSSDVYVPPVIPYAYDYLFKWYGGVVKGKEPSSSQISPLYTIYEVDPPHPERLDAWLKRQSNIGKVEKTATFGGITVERRTRIEKK